MPRRELMPPRRRLMGPPVRLPNPVSSIPPRRAQDHWEWRPSHHSLNVALAAAALMVGGSLLLGFVLVRSGTRRAPDLSQLPPLAEADQSRDTTTGLPASTVSLVEAVPLVPVSPPVTTAASADIPQPLPSLAPVSENPVPETLVSETPTTRLALAPTATVAAVPTTVAPASTTATASVQTTPASRGSAIDVKRH